ncbi:MAG TPA: ABC transporter substrate-binding protein [Candidatus Dormibacteraeota bacterium]|nr:ABC transporter substrate-binding protein [Candidatus Dormibacteraeota bacterium]
MKRAWITFVFVVASVLTLTGCGGGQTGSGAGAAPTRSGGTIVVALPASLESYDPAMYRSRPTEAVLANIFDELVVRLPNGRIVPDLASSYQQLDATRWRFTLRRNVRFQNGQLLTADDVKFTLDRVSQPNQVDGKTSLRQSLLPAMDPATVEGPSSLIVTLKSPSPADILLAGLAHIQIVPAKLINGEGSTAFAAHPVGTGPFEFVAGQLDDETVLQRFPGYWGGPPQLGVPGPARLDRVVFKVIPELSSALAGLTSGSVQIVQGVTPDQVRSLKANPAVVVKSYQDTNTVWFAMNVAKPPFDRVQIRQAMNHAININSIVNHIYDGQAARMTGPVPPFSSYYDTSLKPYSYDPAEAKRLLAAGGYPNGFSLVIDTTAPYQDAAEAAAQDLQKVGVTATVRLWDVTALRQATLAGQRQMALMSWGNSFRHPFDLLNPTLGSGQRGNFADYSNPQVDSLLAAAATTTDHAKAAADYAKVQQIIYQDAPWVFGWAPKAIEAGSARLRGWQPGPDGMELLVHVSMNGA